MPPRAFPLPFRIGIDTCHVPRIQSLIEKNAGGQVERWSTFARRFLTPREVNYFRAVYVAGRSDGSVVPIGRKSEFLAGRWAAKEACIKASKPRKLTPLDIEIWADSDKETYAIIMDSGTSAGETAAAATDANVSAHDYEKQASSGDNNASTDGFEFVPSHEGIQGQIARVSISHDADYASAVALVYSEQHPNDPT